MGIFYPFVSSLVCFQLIACFCIFVACFCCIFSCLLSTYPCCPCPNPCPLSPVVLNFEVGNVWECFHNTFKTFILGRYKILAIHFWHQPTYPLETFSNFLLPCSLCSTLPLSSNQSITVTTRKLTVRRLITFRNKWSALEDLVRFGTQSSFFSLNSMLLTPMNFFTHPDEHARQYACCHAMRCVNLSKESLHLGNIHFGNRSCWS